MHILLGQMLLNGEEVETFWAFDFDSCVRFSWSHCSGVVLGCVCFAHCSKIQKSMQKGFKNKVKRFVIVWQKTKLFTVFFVLGQTGGQIEAAHQQYSVGKERQSPSRLGQTFA